MIKKTLFLHVFLLSISQSLCALPMAEQFKHAGYVEIDNTYHEAAAFNALYACFDEFIKFLQKNPAWTHKLNSAKERFIRSKERSFYGTDFFGFYDESERISRNQISFYYSTHFHEFIGAHYPEFNKIPEIIRFFEMCSTIQQSYADVCTQVAAELGVEAIFCTHGHPPILFKVIKYLPAYSPTKPHYDGTLFSLFLDSTDNQSLLLAPYTLSCVAADFYAPLRKQNSILLIPGTLLTEFSINPTPHIVVHSGNTRYATIAFAMRSDHISHKNEFSLLPNFNH